MSATSYGGVRRQRGGTMTMAPSAAAPSGAPIGPTMPQRGGVYSPAQTGAGRINIGATPQALLLLVALETIALFALRGGFKHYHGG